MTTEEQIIAQELANMQRRNLVSEEVSEVEVYNKLKKDFEREALSIDSSRGFDLTSVKAQYVIERLNEVFGIMGWTFGGEYKDSSEGVLFMGTLVVTIGGKQNRHFAPGFCEFESRTGKKKLLGDVYKSAHTDSLSKCASKFGVANSVFKGLVDTKTLGKSTGFATARDNKSEVSSLNDTSSFKTRSKRSKPSSNTSNQDEI